MSLFQSRALVRFFLLLLVLRSTQLAGIAQDFQTGYGVLTPRLTSPATPAGVAIFGFRQDGNLISEASVPAVRATRAARVFVESGETMDTGVAIANPNDKPAEIRLELRLPDGSRDLSSAVTVSAGGQRAAFLTELFPGLRNFVGSLTLGSDFPFAAVALRRVNNARQEALFTTIPVIDLEASAPAGPFTFPHFATGEGYATQAILINPGAQTLHGVVRFFLQDGQPATVVSTAGSLQATVPYIIPGHGSLRISTASGANLQSGYALVIPDEGSASPSGVAIFSVVQNGVLISEATVPATSASQHFGTYARPSNRRDVGVAIANPGRRVAKVRLRYTSELEIVIPPGGQVAKFVSELFGTQVTQYFFGTSFLDMQSDVPVAALALRLTENERSETILTTFPMINLDGAMTTEKLYFPQVVFGGGYATEIILLPAPITPEVPKFFGGSFDLISPQGGALAPPGRASRRDYYLVTSSVEAFSVAPEIGQPRMTITPGAAAIPYGKSVKFRVEVEGVQARDVFWGASAGTITRDGLYTAVMDYPTESGIAEIYARWVADPFLQVTATVSLTILPPSIIRLSPEHAAVGQEIEITGDLPLRLSGVFFKGAAGDLRQSLDPVVPVAPNRFKVKVPMLASTGELYVTMYGTSTPSNRVTFTRIPTLRMRPERRDVGSGETIRLSTAFMGGQTNERITWSASGGTVSADGMYQAPSGVLADTYVRVRGCIGETGVCDSAILRVAPLRIDPPAIVVPIGQNVQLSAIYGSSRAQPRWTLGGGGSITPDGVFSAPENPADAGGIPIAATFGNFTTTSTLAVTGAFPGLVNRVFDYLDNTSGTEVGTHPTWVASAGKRLYVASTNLPYINRGHSYWIDVYDISDPARPKWMESVESLFGPLFVSGGALHQLVLRSNDETPYLGSVLTFDIQGDRPFLKAITETGLESATFSEGLLYRTSGPTVDVVDLRSGLPVKNRLLIPSVAAGASLLSVAGAGNRLYANVSSRTASSSTTESRLEVYDTSSGAPRLLASVPSSGSYYLRVAGSLVFSGPQVFDVSDGTPVLIASIPIGMVLDASSTRVVTSTFQQGLRVVDVSDPRAPRLSGAVVDTIASVSAASVGNYLYTAGIAGLGVFDISSPGGPIPKWAFQSNRGFSAAFDGRLSGHLLYVAEGSESGAAVDIFDTSVSPPERLSSYNPGQGELAAYALESSGDNLYVATRRTLTVLNVRDPRNPQRVTSLDLQSSCLAKDGTTLFVGTFDGRLAVLDISQPASPIVLSSVFLPGLPLVMRVSQHRLYIAADSAGLLIYDLATPTSPVLLSQMTTSSAIEGVEIDGDLALLADLESGLVVANVQNPRQPSILSRTRLAPEALGLSESLLAVSVGLHDGIAYVGSAYGNGSVFGFDYRRPDQPRLISVAAYGTYVEGPMALSFVFTGTDAYIGGDFGSSYPLIQVDNRQPRNTIRTLVHSSARILSGTTPAPPIAASRWRHPKFAP